MYSVCYQTKVAESVLVGRDYKIKGDKKEKKKSEQLRAMNNEEVFLEVTENSLETTKL